MNQKELKTITNLLFESGMLKRQKEVGSYFAGVDADSTSIADHIMRTCLIAYFLAHAEGADPQKCVMICLFHDLHETRVTDLPKVASRYINKDEAEKKAFYDQTKELPNKIKKEVRELWSEVEKLKTLEGIVAEDADRLEHAISAREYVNIGYQGMQNWINNVKKAVNTNSAKEFIKIIEKSDLNDWYKGLKKLNYKKVNPKSFASKKNKKNN
ncbi:HD domain-containing protein [Patescibacteria group bacterium]|nr:HD domain-containing protein [Patescibacteria group bacterium]